MHLVIVVPPPAIAFMPYVKRALGFTDLHEVPWERHLLSKGDVEELVRMVPTVPLAVSSPEDPWQIYRAYDEYSPDTLRELRTRPVPALRVRETRQNASPKFRVGILADVAFIPVAADEIAAVKILLDDSRGEC